MRGCRAGIPVGGDMLLACVKQDTLTASVSQLLHVLLLAPTLWRIAPYAQAALHPCLQRPRLR